MQDTVWCINMTDGGSDLFAFRGQRVRFSAAAISFFGSQDTVQLWSTQLEKYWKRQCMESILRLKFQAKEQEKCFDFPAIKLSGLNNARKRSYWKRPPSQKNFFSLSPALSESTWLNLTKCVVHPSPDINCQLGWFNPDKFGWSTQNSIVVFSIIGAVCDSLPILIDLQCGFESVR